MKNITILWTGGWDSTYRMLELSRMEITVQPIYCGGDNRKSESFELKAMKKILELLRNNPATKAVFSEVKYIDINKDIPENKEITDAYNRVHKKTGLGSQHEWLARLATIYPGIEIGTEAATPETSRLINSIEQFGKLSFEGGGHLDPEKSTRDGMLVLGGFSYPIIHLTERKMLENVRTYGYEDIMSHIWFCHTPLKGTTCGLCHPCHVKMESDMEFLLSKDAVKRYRLQKKIEKRLGKRISEKLSYLYRAKVKKAMN